VQIFGQDSDQLVHALAITMLAKGSCLAGGRDVKFRSQTQVGAEERDTLWSWLAVACVACLLSEVTALKAFKT